MEFGTIDDGKAFAAVLKHDARLDDRSPAFVQVRYDPKLAIRLSIGFL
jgi:hypothetical protein